MKITKSRFAFYATLLILLSTIPALAADVTGTWTSQDKSADGTTFDLTFTFKQDGAKLTGTVTVSGSDTTGNINGKIDGNKISFIVALGDTTITHEGTIAGDEIKVTAKSSDPSFPVHDITLKRSK